MAESPGADGLRQGAKAMTDDAMARLVALETEVAQLRAALAEALRGQVAHMQLCDVQQRSVREVLQRFCETAVP